MALEKWALHWDVGQQDDGTWLIVQVDPTTNATLLTCAAASINIDDGVIHVDMELRDTPPIPETVELADGRIAYQPSWRMESVRSLVSDLIIYDWDYLYGELQGKTWALEFYDKQSGELFKAFAPRLYK